MKIDLPNEQILVCLEMDRYRFKLDDVKIEHKKYEIEKITKKTIFSKYINSRYPLDRLETVEPGFRNDYLFLTTEETLEKDLHYHTRNYAQALVRRWEASLEQKMKETANLQNEIKKLIKEYL